MLSGELMKKIITLLLCFGLVGCASVSDYHPFNNYTGYNNLKLQDNIFKIGYQDDQFSTVQKVEDYALLRAAEVTLDNGYKYFTELNSSDDSKTSLHTSKRTGKVRLIEKPSTTITIQCYKAKPVDITGVIYDAEQIKTNIRNSYGVK